MTMIRWTSLLGAVMLVLILWTGAAAHAAEQFTCIPASSEAIGHFDGDEDQAPSSPDQGVAHHHTGCGGHYFAAPADIESINVNRAGDTVPRAWRQSGKPGDSPDTDLRPPIA